MAKIKKQFSLCVGFEYIIAAAPTQVVSCAQYIM